MVMRPGSAEVGVNAIAASSLIADLRTRRRDIRREIARVRWWRRLVAARRELALAGLAQPEPLAADGLESALQALSADAPTSRELVGAVWPDAMASTPATLDHLDGLDARLERYEALLGDSLDTVTAQMVSALGRAHDSETTTEGEHG